AGARRELRAALALWRGPALADLPDRAGSAVRLEAQRAEARRRRIAADLALGRSSEVAAELAGLCADEPLDEPLHVLWIRALHRSGRTAQALERYETLRRALADQLGTDPGAQLRQAYQELLAGEAPAAVPEPSPASSPVAPPATGTTAAPAVVPATAARTTPGPGAPRAGPAQPSGPVGNLRPRLTSFVGREQDLGALADLLGSARLITLIGPGGSGKTRLSVEVGQSPAAATAWPDGVWQAELAPLRSAAAVPAAVLSALGLRGTVLHPATMGDLTEPRSEDPVRRIVEHCGRARMLLVLDNCEHLIQAAAELADRLLAECPQLSILATSREPLGVPGEAVLPVEPLPVPIAVRLFAERGAAARPGFDPADDPEASAEICRRLDGLPLAIELAAARLRAMTPRQLADRLDGRFALLTGGSRVLLPRQQTLRAVVDWSWELLDWRERALLRRLSVFAGGWTLEDAEQVCADDALLPGGEVAELLLSLVDKSLLVAGLDQPGPPRYRMLETIHEYAVERLAEAGEEWVAVRHREHFRELARTAELDMHGHRQVHWIGVLERERDNIRVALRHAVDAGAEQDAVVLVLGMAWFWVLRDYRAEAREWIDRVCAMAEDPYADGAPVAQPLERGPLEYPLPWPGPVAEEARRQLWLYQLISRFETNMDVIGDEAQRERAPRILAAYHPDLPQSYSYPPLLRIFAAFLSGQPDAMIGLIDQAVDGCRRHGRPSELAWVLQLRAKMSNDRVGGLAQARLDGDESFAIYERLGDSWGMSEALAAQAETAGFCGDAATAAAAYRRAIELAVELGAPQEIPLLQIRLGEALLETEPVEGERLIRQALGRAGTAGQQAEGTLIYGHMVLSGLYSHRGEHEAARHQLTLLAASRGKFGPVVPQIFDGMLACAEALVMARCGEVDEGVRRLGEGLRVLREIPAGAMIFAEHVTLMMLPVATGVMVIRAQRDQDRELSHRIGLLAGAHTARTGVQGSYLDRHERAAREQALIGLLGRPRYERACEQGHELSWEEVVALLAELTD
ncbi:ATP-binding protein, partial [Kitasatospora nipponensis]|uniref:ATP-binding protein n=1 Tax=Kitasatospora nipponensis TaxID=258049 RepID=UPI0031D46177